MVKSIQILLCLAENHVKCMVSHGFLSPLEPFFFLSALPRSATGVLPHLPRAFRAFQERSCAGRWLICVLCPGLWAIYGT